MSAVEARRVACAALSRAFYYAEGCREFAHSERDEVRALIHKYAVEVGATILRDDRFNVSESRSATSAVLYDAWLAVAEFRRAMAGAR